MTTTFLIERKGRPSARIRTLYSGTYVVDAFDKFEELWRTVKQGYLWLVQVDSDGVRKVLVERFEPMVRTRW